MPRPRGRIKTARISVNFDPEVYGTLLLLAKNHDVPVAQVIRHAVAQLIATPPANGSNSHPATVLSATSAATSRGGST